eukprot:754935-Hanusia_phi.AAC.4
MRTSTSMRTSTRTRMDRRERGRGRGPGRSTALRERPGRGKRSAPSSRFRALGSIGSCRVRQRGRRSDEDGDDELEVKPGCTTSRLPSLPPSLLPSLRATSAASLGPGAAA